MAVRLISASWTHFGLLSLKKFDSYFLDMMYVEFMKNFFSPIRASLWLLDSFRHPELISASWAQKRLIPTF